MSTDEAKVNMWLEDEDDNKSVTADANKQEQQKQIEGSTTDVTSAGGSQSLSARRAARHSGEGPSIVSPLRLDNNNKGGTHVGDDNDDLDGSRRSQHSLSESRARNVISPQLPHGDPPLSSSLRRTRSGSRNASEEAKTTTPSKAVEFSREPSPDPRPTPQKQENENERENEKEKEKEKEKEEEPVATAAAAPAASGGGMSITATFAQQHASPTKDAPEDVDVQLSLLRKKRSTNSSEHASPPSSHESGGESDGSATKFGPPHNMQVAPKQHRVPPRHQQALVNAQLMADDEVKAIAQELSGADWSKQQEALQKLRDFLISSDAGQTTERLGALRKQLKPIIGSVVRITDNPRSSVAKVAIDTISLMCKKLNPSNTAVPTAVNGLVVTTPGSSPVTPASGTKAPEMNVFDPHADNLFTKLISKGGPSSAKFLFDAALFTIRELVECTTLSKTMNVLLSMPCPKTDKSKVLWSEGINHCLERASPAQLARVPDVVGRIVVAVDHLVHDPWQDVRDAGKKMATGLVAYCEESGERLDAIIVRQISSEIHREKVLLTCGIQVRTAEPKAKLPQLQQPQQQQQPVPPPQPQQQQDEPPASTQQHPQQQQQDDDGEFVRGRRQAKLVKRRSTAVPGGESATKAKQQQPPAKQDTTTPTTPDSPATPETPATPVAKEATPTKKEPVKDVEGLPWDDEGEQQKQQVEMKAAESSSDDVSGGDASTNKEPVREDSQILSSFLKNKPSSATSTSKPSSEGGPRPRPPPPKQQTGGGAPGSARQSGRQYTPPAETKSTPRQASFQKQQQINGAPALQLSSKQSFTSEESPRMSSSARTDSSSSSAFKKGGREKDNWASVPALNRAGENSARESTPEYADNASIASARGNVSSASSPRAGSFNEPPPSREWSSEKFNNTNFTSTLTRECREHGSFSMPIYLAAEGNFKERSEAITRVHQLCMERLMTLASPEKGSKKAERKQEDNEDGGPFLRTETALALCDVVALRCADTNNKVQVAALECVSPLMKVIPPEAVDATAPKWVSCITTALSSSYVAIYSAAIVALSAVLRNIQGGEDVRNLLHSVATTAVSVRNPNAKSALLQSLCDLITRFFQRRTKASSEEAQREEIGLAPDDTRGDPQTPPTGKRPIKKATLANSDGYYLMSMCTKVLTDRRPEIQMHANRLVLTLYHYCLQDAILDEVNLSKEQWRNIKALIDESNANGGRIALPSNTPQEDVQGT